ncbi:MAG: hypothetical protein KTR31_15290 [Myxococcales bacterium]|nr:hypothetical protein [Myxococcales bacterium]
MTPHPSFLALDRHALGDSTAEVEAHVHQCDQCRAYVGTIRRDPGPAPLGLMQRAERRWWRWPALVLPLVAVGAALAAILWSPVAEDPWLATKGHPHVEVWVRSDQRVYAFDGRPLSAGDSIRLRVDPAGFDHVEVRTGRDVLYTGQLHGPEDLPASWRLDHAPGPERIEITLSHPDRPSWSTTLLIDKEVAP